MDIWDYDRRTGRLLGSSVADPNPEDPGGWLIPAYATTIRPPVAPEGCVAMFNGGLSAVGEWRIEMLDFSGASVKERAAISLISAFVSSRVEDCEDRDKALADVTQVIEDRIDRMSDEKAVRDYAKSVVQTLIYGKSVN
jgi:hypothetical protein